MLFISYKVYRRTLKGECVMVTKFQEEDFLLTGKRLEMVLIGSTAIGICVGCIAMMASNNISFDQFIFVAPLTAIASFFVFGTVNYLIGDWHRRANK